MFARGRQPQVVIVEQQRRPLPWSVSIYYFLRYGTRKHRIITLTVLALIFLIVFGALISLGIASHQVTSK